MKIVTVRRVLVMTAVEAERDAVLRGLRGTERFDVRLAGVGPASAAAHTALALAAAAAPGGYDLVISAGIGGGFTSAQAVEGSLVVASGMIAADLGVETNEGFRSVDELGFGASRIGIEPSLVNKVAEALRGAGLGVRVGPILTVSTATGTAETAAELASRVPDAAAEAMEGYGVAAAARICGIPVLEIRAISNRVGPRDRAAWRIGDALQSLEAAFIELSEVL